MSSNFNYQKALKSLEQCQCAIKAVSLTQQESNLLNDRLKMLQAQIEQQTLKQPNHEWPIDFAQ